MLWERFCEGNMKFTLAISGASGVHLGLRFLSNLPKEWELFLVLSRGAKEVITQEKTPLEFSQKLEILDCQDLGACIASGSFGVEKMAIIPTSMNKLAKISHGIADDLITRAASVMIKERKTLLLAPREMPLSPIALENMLRLSQTGVIIAPPILGYYAGIEDLEGMEDFLIGKWLDSLQIPHNLYRRWKA
ncbi:putative Phenylacrylic acid decarboxylase [Helicobacter mustelae 12198]|uniref:Putative Phenylacrylic acid decarboxylase n=2 Tax=Helicobacter mustelae TaxID=217 RepID=D3UGB7_HELM1|nr:putative Phenylacrylic acid decarboxylase [Helicobacter mustelae 12198]